MSYHSKRLSLTVTKQLTPWSFVAHPPVIYAEGDYDVVIPASTAAGFYVIRVGLFGEDAVYGCSQPFEVVPQGEELWN